MTTETRQSLRAAVTQQILRLQRDYINNKPAAVRDLAALRKDIGHQPGDNAHTWEHTLGVVPEHLVGKGYHPTAAERAGHAAMTLFALHQQGRFQQMHKSGVGFGEAVRELSRRHERNDGSSEAVQRRFRTLLSAGSWGATLHHLRGLVSQFRAEQIPLDYGQLAGDLVHLQSPDRAAGVRLTWGRQFHRHVSSTDNATSGSADAAPTEDRS